MPTSDQYVNLVLKRFLSQNRMETNFRAYLEGIITDGLSRIFPSSGLFTFPVGMTFPSAGKFSLDTDPVEGIDNGGHVLELVGSTYTSGISYEENDPDIYWVAYKFIEIPSGVYNNPRTGIPEYDKTELAVGEVDSPTNVTEGTGDITFNVNSIFESTVDHSGRTVRVWLVNPVSGDPSVAFEDCVVSYSSPNNTITTTGLLGQSSPVPILVDNYKVACLGVTVRNSDTNPFGDEYIIIGKITVSGTPAFSNADQNDLSGGGGHTLQKAYDGLGGSGSGRTVQVDDQAIQLRQGASANREDDVANAALRLRKDLDTTIYGSGGFDHEMAIDLPMRMKSKGGLLVRIPIVDLSGNDELRAEEDAQVAGAGDDITLTRTVPPVDLTLASSTYSDIWATVDLAEVSGSSLGQNGLYIINSLTSTTLQLYELDGTASSLVVESGLKVRVYRPFAWVAPNLTGFSVLGINDFYREYHAAAMTVPGISVKVPSGSHDDDKLIHVERSGGGSFHVTALGDATLTGKYSGGSVDVTNTIEADGNITSDQQVSGATVVAGTNITSTNGDITASGSGKTVSANIVKSIGTSGVVETTSDGVFRYAGAQTLWKTISINLAEPGRDTENYWYFNYTGTGSSWTVEYTGSSDDFELNFPITLPDGSTIKECEVRVKIPSGPSLQFNLYRQEAKFGGGTGDGPSRTSIGFSTASSPGNWETVSLTGLSETVDNTQYSYYITVLVTTAITGVFVAGARVKFDVTNVKLN
jgi:hypothetical protein